MPGWLVLQAVRYRSALGRVRHRRESPEQQRRLQCEDICCDGISHPPWALQRLPEDNCFSKIKDCTRLVHKIKGLEPNSACKLIGRSVVTWRTRLLENDQRQPKASVSESATGQLITGRQVNVPENRIVEMTEEELAPLINSGARRVD
jgi:hypothetical protein